MSEIQNGDHERWDEDAAAHALRALDEAELRVFEEHLATCTRCQDELARMREVVDELPTAAPVAAPGADLKQRVMATVRAEAAAPADSGVTVEPRRDAPRKRWLVARPWLKPGVVAGGAAAVALLVVLVVLTAGNGGSARTYAGIVHAPGAHASVRQSGNSAQLRFSGLPAPPPGRIYQVWLKRAGRTPQPTQGLFMASTGTVAVQGSLRGLQAVFVTAEPRPNGSRAPTRTPLIIVRLA